MEICGDCYGGCVANIRHSDDQREACPERSRRKESSEAEVEMKNHPQKSIRDALGLKRENVMREDLSTACGGIEGGRNLISRKVAKAQREKIIKG